MRLTISLGVLWAAVGVNLRGVALYERLMVPLMFLTFVLGGVVIVAGFSFDHARLRRRAARARGTRDSGGRRVAGRVDVPVCVGGAVCVVHRLRFDRAGGRRGEEPGRNLPLAIGLAVGSVGVFYMLFTAAVYHAVPWQYIAAEAQRRDLTAPGLLGYLLPPFWTVVIVSAAAVALAKDLPAMLLAVSRLMFAWAEDGIFPRGDRRGASASSHAARRDRRQRRHGDARRARQPPGRRLLPRRRHSGHVDAGELPADGGRRC